MELKCDNIWALEVGSKAGSNRTFMELKSITTDSIYDEADSSNRTFMELKSKITIKVIAILLVLIVPLWN